MGPSKASPWSRAAGQRGRDLQEEVLGGGGEGRGEGGGRERGAENKKEYYYLDPATKRKHGICIAETLNMIWYSKQYIKSIPYK